MLDVRHTLRRLLIIALLLVVAAAAAASDPVHEVMTRILNSARDLMLTHAVIGKIVFVVLSAASAMLAFFSTAVIVPIAVYAWGDRTTFFLLWTGWLAGGATAYWIAYLFGRRVAAWFASGERFDYFASRISRDADFVTILLFQLGLPSEIPGYVLGAVHYRFPIYFAALALAELPFAVGAVYLGDSFLQRNFAILIALGLLGVALVFVATHALRRRIGGTTDAPRELHREQHG